MAISKATTRQPLPYHTSYQAVIGSGLDWKNSFFSAARGKVVYSQTSFHHVWPGVSLFSNNNYCVNAAPCRQLVWGKECKGEKLTGPQQEQRDC